MKPKTSSEPHVFTTKGAFNLSYPEQGEAEPRKYLNYETFSSTKTQFAGKGIGQKPVTRVFVIWQKYKTTPIITPTNMST